MLKFYWNGIKEDGGPLQLCTYHDGELRTYPGGTITIYGKRYRDFSQGIHQAFVVQDESEIQSDYIVNEHIRVMPEHPLYVEVARALQAMKAHNSKRWAKRSQRMVAGYAHANQAMAD